MGIINEFSIISEKNGIKKIINPDPNRRGAGEVFYVNPAKRTITCVLYGCCPDATNLVYKYAGHLLSGFYEDLSINYSYVGIARQDPGDEFDEEYGMRLARYRANRKREGDVKVAIRNFNKKVRQCADLLDRKVETSPKPPVKD